MKPAYVCRYPKTEALTAVLPSRSLRELVLRGYVRKGWKYFVLYPDVNGFGLQAARRAVWQDDASHVSILR
jgi:hypothetical protein